MKKIFLLSTLGMSIFFLPKSCPAFAIINDYTISQGNIGSRSDEILKIPVKQNEKSVRKKLNFFEWVSYGFLKIKLKNSLKKNPNFKLKNDISEPKKKRFGKGGIITLLVILLFVLGVVFILTDPFIFS